MEELFSYIKKFGLLNESDQLLIAAGIQEIKIRKGETFVVEAGKPSQRIAFVKDGVFRSLYYNKQEMTLPAILSMKVALSGIFRGLPISCRLMRI